MSGRAAGRSSDREPDGWQDLRALSVALAVREAGSLRGAADALGCSAQAVAQRMASLERALGMPVYERAGQRVRLTDAGMALARHAEAIKRELDGAAHDLVDLARADAPPTIRLACHHSPHTSPAQMAAAFERRFEDMRLGISTLDPEPALRLLEAGEVDAALIYGFPDLCPVRIPAGFAARHVMTHRLWAMLPSAHRLARAKTVPLPALAGDPWLLREEGSVIHRAVLRACRAAGFDPDVRFTGPDAVLADLVRRGRGVALTVPLWAEHPDCSLRPLTEDVCAREALVAREDSEPVAAIARIARATQLALAERVPAYRAWLAAHADETRGRPTAF